jgi:hypothetical protein
VAVPNVVDQDIRNRAPFVTALAQQHVKRISDPRKLLTSRGKIIEEIKHQSGIEAQARAVDEMTTAAVASGSRRRGPDIPPLMPLALSDLGDPCRRFCVNARNCSLDATCLAVPLDGDRGLFAGPQPSCDAIGDGQGRP